MNSLVVNDPLEFRRDIFHNDKMEGLVETPELYLASGEQKEALTPHISKIAILDAGSQYGGLIDRSIRELGVRSDILALDTSPDQLQNFDAIIISGGPDSVYDTEAAQCHPDLFSTGKPILGICYGMQLMSRYMGGNVGNTSRREDGPENITLDAGSSLFSGLSTDQRVVMSHGDSVTHVPEGFKITAQSGELIAAMSHESKKLYGVQFHPEVDDTKQGAQMLSNFLFDIAGLEADYTLEDQEQEAIESIRQMVGDRNVMLFLSGGVDSTVLAALMARAIEDKEKIHAFHIDTGFMRQDESQGVLETLASAGIHVEVIDASEQFLTASTIDDGKSTPPLNEVTDPQVKRKIIGDTFVRIREQILSEHGLDDDTVLAQGSLRPDLIESGSQLASSQADTIKTHHNDTEAVRQLRALGRVVEPLQELYKDQVRALGKKLGLPDELVDRQPFPGPGLAIRIICTQEAQRHGTLSTEQTQLDTFMEVETGNTVQAHILPIQTVGVQGDHRSYKQLVGLTTNSPPNWEQLLGLASKIPQHHHAVNRIAYVFGDVDRQRLGVTRTTLMPEVVEQLRHADAIVTQTLERFNLGRKLSQVPVVLFPVDFGRPGMRGIALRPFITRDFMTGTAAVPGKNIPEEFLHEVAGRVLTEVPGIARLVYDLTSKPPGTTEWE